MVITICNYCLERNPSCITYIFIFFHVAKSAVPKMAMKKSVVKSCGEILKSDHRISKSNLEKQTRKSKKKVDLNLKKCTLILKNQF